MLDKISLKAIQPWNYSAMKQTPLTIKDIAKALKISPSTVSRALQTNQEL